MSYEETGGCVARNFVRIEKPCAGVGVRQPLENFSHEFDGR